MKGHPNFAEGYRQVLAGITGRGTSIHGYPERAVKAAEARLGLPIPTALRDYYLSVGRHPLNRIHNRLLPPDDLSLTQGRLVFMEENQWVVFWGVPGRSRVADPMVFQTMDRDEGDWTAEVRCSQFLPGMLCWHATGSMPHTGYTDELPAAAARRSVRGWPSVGRSGVHSAYARGGQVVCLADSGYGVLIQVGARNRPNFLALVSELGIEIHEA